MPSRFPSSFFLIGAAGLAALLLIPADVDRLQVTGLAVGDTPPAPVRAAPAPIKTEAPATAAAAVDAASPLLPPPAAPVETPQDAAVAAIAPADATPSPIATYAWVGWEAVNVRAGPSSGTARLFVLKRGAKVAIMERSGGWAFVTDQNGESGWVYSRYLADAPASAAARPLQPAAPGLTGKYGRIGSAVLLRAGPSRFAPSLFVLRPGERIAVVETRGRWLRVVLESGASAWVDVRDLSR